VTSEETSNTYSLIFHAESNTSGSQVCFLVGGRWGDIVVDRAAIFADRCKRKVAGGFESVLCIQVSL